MARANEPTRVSHNDRVSLSRPPVFICLGARSLAIALAALALVLPVSAQDIVNAPPEQAAAPSSTDVATETEPNNRITEASKFDPDVAIGGSISGGDRDFFRFELRDDGKVRDIGFKLDTHTNIDLCLFDAEGERRKCTRGRNTTLHNVALDGEYILSIAPVARIEEVINYTLAASPARAAAKNREIEPNDRQVDAVALGDRRVIKGTLPHGDHDSYLLRVESDFGIWRIAATGTSVNALRLYNGGGIQLHNRSGRQGGVQMENLLLPPGNYVVQVYGGRQSEDVEYTLEVAALGAPETITADSFSLAPGASRPQGAIEFEPNDQEGQAQRLRFDEPRMGFLPKGDKDVYRFYLPGHGRVRITAEPAAGGKVNLGFSSKHKVGGKETDAPAVFEGDLAAGDHYLTLTTHPAGSGLYKLTMTRLDPLLQEDKPLHDVSLTLAGGGRQPIAAYLAGGQRIKLNLNIRNEGSTQRDLSVVTASSDFNWRPAPNQATLSLAAGQSKRVAIDVDILPDARADMPVHLSAGVRAADGATASRMLSIAAACAAPPVNPRQVWPIPDAFLGKINVAAIALGAKVLSEGRYDGRGFDGVVARMSGAYTRVARPEPLRIDLAGDAPVTLIGSIIHPVGSGRREMQLRDYEIHTSLDGSTYSLAHAGTLTSDAAEQSVVFDQPVQARFAELHYLNNHGDKGTIAIGEWKLIATEPAHAIIDGPLNIGGFDLGGHDTHSQPYTSAPCCREILSTAKADGQFQQRAREYEWVMNFRDSRAARIVEFGWIDLPQRQHAKRDIMGVHVSVSMTGPFGPWQPLADWPLQRDGDKVSRLKLVAPVWARFVRFRSYAIDDNWTANMPQQVQIFEQTADDGYQSVIGEWGYANRSAIYERQHPTVAIRARTQADAAADRRSATVLKPGETRTGTVLVGEDVDWYAIEVPGGANQMRLQLLGDPSIDYAWQIQDAGGATLTGEQTKIDNGIELTFAVDPGHYYLRLHEPPRSVVFSWDTSGSVNAFYDVIDQTMKAFAAGVRTGREEVNLLPFADSGLAFLLDDWSGDSTTVSAAVVNSDRNFGSSNAESAITKATFGLKGREGTRAILLITDAITDGIALTAPMWAALEEVRPRIFSFEISANGSQVAQAMMQSYAEVNQGFYDQAFSAGDLQVGFDRATCLLRKAKTYHATAFVDAVEPKPPGRLIVALDDPGTSETRTSGDAVEVILDASGSMFRKLDGRFRYQIAKDVLDDLVAATIPDNIGFALRVFGNRDASSCRTDLEVVLAPLDRERTRGVIKRIEPRPYAYTPIADSLAKVPADLKGVKGRRTVVLVTDGEESCDGDVESAIEQLQAGGVDVQLNVIGFDFDADDKEAAREQFRRWAKLGGGHYYDASNADELAQSLTEAVSDPLPFEVLDHTGTVVATGVANGEATELLTGTYTVRSLGKSPQVVNKVVIKSESVTNVKLSRD